MRPWLVTIVTLTAFFGMQLVNALSDGALQQSSNPLQIGIATRADRSSAWRPIRTKQFSCRASAP